MKKIIIITQDNAAEVYKNADTEVKQAIKDNFNLDIKDRVKTFEDACEVLGLDVDLLNFTRCDSDEVAYKKLKVIIQALNEGWKPNWDNYDEYKWRPWFYLDAPGFRFYGSYCVFSYSYSAGGSRLCFKSEELCKYAATQFLDLYKDLYN